MRPPKRVSRFGNVQQTACQMSSCTAICESGSASVRFTSFRPDRSCPRRTLRLHNRHFSPCELQEKPYTIRCSTSSSKAKRAKFARLLACSRLCHSSAHKWNPGSFRLFVVRTHNNSLNGFVRGSAAKQTCKALSCAAFPHKCKSYANCHW